MDKLLIVDDEVAMRRLLRINLEDRYEIVDTGNSEQALAMAMQDKFNAILLDLRMPNYSGFELCRTFKSMSSTQLIPTIIISGEGAQLHSLFARSSEPRRTSKNQLTLTRCGLNWKRSCTMPVPTAEVKCGFTCESC